MKRLIPAVIFEEVFCGHVTWWEWVYPAILLKSSPREAASTQGSKRIYFVKTGACRGVKPLLQVS
ncbi:hypothetical protein [Pseudoalteromonas piscicida]|uniref:hypothetical protein n=1 Tax=Pseudoalteromonas piscicida TaxID=43662 RepID=UPI001246CBFD|nr:hypothetical protein [Pseudoalteromonas piscicida]